jgi:hypothetical protein
MTLKFKPAFEEFKSPLEKRLYRLERDRFFVVLNQISLMEEMTSDVNPDVAAVASRGEAQLLLDEIETIREWFDALAQRAAAIAEAG